MNNNYNGQVPGQQYYGQPMNQPVIPEAYKPISAWGYFGYEILFSIPLIGFIFLLIYALGGTSNINLKNFARSYFCALVLMVIIFVIMFIIFGAGFFAYGVNTR